MKRIKSAPANICEMVNRKKINNLKKEKLSILILPNKNEKQIKNTLSNIIQDTFSETNKYIPDTDNYYYSLILEIFSNFLENKFNKENVKNFIFMLIIRIFFSNISHNILITYKNDINNFLHLH
tara:strand:- start:6202 stop:6573 length:372 start_codon:yes stop_codon:yes gene_type:complete